MTFGTRQLARVAAASVAALLLSATASAGDLEPPGPPAPTMKTLDEIPGSWHRLLDSTNGDAEGCNSDRFRCVMGGEAVLDLETGLVWQRGVYDNGAASHWLGARSGCLNQHRGGRYGWRLPSIMELTSLFDLSLPEPYLPSGHPFTVELPPDATRKQFWSGNLDIWDHAISSAPEPLVVATGLVTTTEASQNGFIFFCVRGPGSTPAQ